MSEMTLYNPQGNRLYLNAEERAAFLAAARQRPARDRTLCETLHFTGLVVEQKSKNMIQTSLPFNQHGADFKREF